MAENKTKVTEQSVKKFIDAIPDKQTRDDCFALVSMMEKAAKADAKMWGSSIVGFGQYHYKYESGREGEAMLVGFSPRKDKLTLYIYGGFDKHPELMDELGKYKTGKGCLYIKKLDDVNVPKLKKLIEASVKDAKTGHT
jgi:hypothetical protein